MSKNFLPLSSSRIQAYVKCPKMFHYRYIEKRDEEFISVEAFSGRVVHKTLYDFFQSLKGNSIPKVLALLKIAKKNWEEGLKENNSIKIITYPKKIKQWELNTYKLIEGFYWDNYPFKKIDKSYFEEEVNFNLNESISVRCFIDKFFVYPNRSIEIFDYKTGRRKPPDSLDDDMQAAIYTMALKSKFPDSKIKTIWHFLLYKKKVKKQFTDKELKKWKEKIESIYDDICNEKEWAAKTSRLCSWCGYNGICEKGKKYLE